AASGISNAPGTRRTSILESSAPWRTRPSRAPSRSRSAMKLLNLPTTMPKVSPFASSLPSMKLGMITSVVIEIGFCKSKWRDQGSAKSRPFLPVTSSRLCLTCSQIFQQMPHLLPLGLKVFQIHRRGLDLDGNPVDNVDSVAFKTYDLLGVVGHQTYIPDTQIYQDLRPDAVVAKIRLESELQIRFYRILPLILQRVGFQLVDKPDAPPFLPHIEDNPPAGTINHCHGTVQLLAAVTPAAPEDIAGHALGMNPDQNRFVGRNIAFDQGKMFQLVHIVEEGHSSEISAVNGRDRHLCSTAHQRFILHPVSDEIGNGTDLQAMLDGKLPQLRHSRHCAVVVHDLADDPGRFQPGQLCKIDGAFRLPGPDKDPAAPGPKRKDMPRTGQIFGPAVVCYRGQDRMSPVGSRNAGRDPLFCLDRDGKSGPERG